MFGSQCRMTSVSPFKMGSCAHWPSSPGVAEAFGRHGAPGLAKVLARDVKARTQWSTGHTTALDSILSTCNNLENSKGFEASFSFLSTIYETTNSRGIEHLLLSSVHSWMVDCISERRTTYQLGEPSSARVIHHLSRN